MDVRFHVELAPARQRALNEMVTPLVTLEHVVRWSLTLDPIEIADVINQDEYTVDVVMPYRDLWLVFDST